jgi:hypothetical protein
MKTIVTTFGKFAVVSQGHIKVFEKIRSIATQNRADLRIYLSKAEKPLPYKEKVKWARKSFPKLRREIQDSNVNNIFDVLVDIYKSGYEKVVVVVGGDRIREFSNLLPKYNGVKSRHGFYEFQEIEIVSAGDRDPDADDVSGLSSSKLRQAVIDEDKELFMSGVSTYLSKIDKEEYYEVVKKYMGLGETLKIPRFRDLISEKVDNPYFSTYDVIANTERSIPPLFFSPAMWKRVKGQLENFEGWHITDPENMKNVMRIAGTNRTISVTTKLEGAVVYGLKTKGGIALHIRGQKIFGLPKDFFSQRTKEGIKVKRALPQSQLVTNLSIVWRKTVLNMLEEVLKMKSRDDTEEKNKVYEVVTKAANALKRMDSETTLSSTKIKPTNDEVYNFGITNVGDVLNILKGLKAFDRTIVTSNTNFDFGPTERKRLGSIMRDLVSHYIDGTEVVLKRTNIEEFMKAMEEEQLAMANWDEHLITKFEVVHVYQYTAGLENDYPELDQYDFLSLSHLRKIKMNESLNLNGILLRERELIQKIKDYVKPITKKELDEVEKYVDRLFSKIDVDVNFTRHFLDRVNDRRNVKQISTAELIRIFRETYKKYGAIIPTLGDDAQAVLKDMQTDINIPFVLNYNKRGEIELVSKTVMRKKGFRTSNPVLTVEQKRQEWHEIMKKVVKSET